MSPIFVGNWRKILLSLGYNYRVSLGPAGVSSSGGAPEMVGPLTSSLPLSPSPMDRGGEDHGASASSSFWRLHLPRCFPIHWLLRIVLALQALRLLLVCRRLRIVRALQVLRRILVLRLLFGLRLVNGKPHQVLFKGEVDFIKYPDGFLVEGHPLRCLLLPRNYHIIKPGRGEELRARRLAIDCAQPDLKYTPPYTAKVDASSEISDYYRR